VLATAQRALQAIDRVVADDGAYGSSSSSNLGGSWGSEDEGESQPSTAGRAVRGGSSSSTQFEPNLSLEAAYGAAGLVTEGFADELERWQRVKPGAMDAGLMREVSVTAGATCVVAGGVGLQEGPEGGQEKPGSSDRQMLCASTC
jgi:hypothetical protein